MSLHFNVLTGATEWVLSEPRKLCLNLWSQRWLRPSVSLVSNSTPLGLWHLKTLLLKGRINFKSFYLKIFRFFEFHIFWFSLFHTITAEGKKNFGKNYVLLWTENIIIISCVVWAHESGKNIEQMFWRLVSKYFKEAAQLPVPSSFFKSVQT